MGTRCCLAPGKLIFGGLVVQRVLSGEGSKDEKEGGKWSGMVLMGSTPPSGNGPMVWRVLRRDGIGRVWSIIRGLLFEDALKDVRVCRDLFFSKESYGPAESDDVLRGYMKRFEEGAKNKSDLAELNRKLPAKRPGGVAPWANSLPPTLVLGGNADSLVDVQAVMETAKFYETKEIIIDAPHDLMLYEHWEQPAQIIRRWPENNFETNKLRPVPPNGSVEQ